MEEVGCLLPQFDFHFHRSEITCSQLQAEWSFPGCSGTLAWWQEVNSVVSGAVSEPRSDLLHICLSCLKCLHIAPSLLSDKP